MGPIVPMGHRANRANEANRPYGKILKRDTRRDVIQWTADRGRAKRGQSESSIYIYGPGCKRFPYYCNGV